MSDQNAIKVYLAACFGRIEEMRGVARWLRSLGYVVTSRWLDDDVDDADLPTAQAAKAASVDMADVLAADVLVAFAERAGFPGAERGGRHVEMGAALATGKAVILVGSPEHIFHHHPSVTVVACKTDMARALRAFAESRQEVAA